jgi:hypothetical protein
MTLAVTWADAVPLLSTAATPAAIATTPARAACRVNLLVDIEKLLNK